MQAPPNWSSEDARSQRITHNYKKKSTNADYAANTTPFSMHTEQPVVLNCALPPATGATTHGIYSYERRSAPGSHSSHSEGSGG